MQESRGDESPNIFNQGGGDIHISYGSRPDTPKPPRRPGWRNPAIVAAVITAVATLAAAFLERPPAPKPESPAPTIQQSPIHQFGKGDQSPNVVNSGGGTVTVTIGEPAEKASPAKEPGGADKAGQ